MHRIRLSWILLSMAVAFPAYAQETGTGSVTEGGPTTTEMMIVARTQRAQGFRAAVLKTRKDLEAIAKKQAALREKRAANRAECRVDIRRANRDAKFDVSQVCYREDLSLTHQLLAHDWEIIILLPGLLEQTRTAAATQAGATDEAITAIMDAIDTGVFRSIEELEEAKRNLGTKYQLPLYEELRYVRADHLVSWIAHLLTRAEKAKQEMDAEARSTDKLVDAMACLEGAETPLYRVLDKENKESHKTDLSQAQSNLKLCVPLLQAAERFYEKEQAALEE